MKKYLTIDLGGTAIKYGVIDEELNILYKSVKDARCGSYEELLADLREIKSAHGEGCEGICISMPGIIDRFRGFAHTGGAYLWVKDRYLARELSEELGAAVCICNDGKAAAIAEIGYGNLKGINNGVAIILGTGIAGGIVINGKLVDGAHFTAGELSYLRGNVKPTTNRDMFAFYNGVQGLKNAIYEASGRSDIDGLKAFRLIKEEHNEKVLQGVRDFCWYLAHYIYNIQVITDAERLVIGGGISNEPMFIDLVREAVDEKFRSALFHQIQPPEVMLCKFKRDANLIGALYNFVEIRESDSLS